MFRVLESDTVTASTSGVAIDLSAIDGLTDGCTFLVLLRNQSTTIACTVAVDGGEAMEDLPPLDTATGAGRGSTGPLRYIAGTSSVTVTSASGTPTVSYEVRKLAG